MIIDSIRFENYRAYYGETDFSFPVDGERNISIIFADNDVGKSCFFSGILFCLYGEPDTDKFKDLINVNAQQEGVFRAAVSIFATHNGSKIEITRTIEPRGSISGEPASKDLKTTLTLVKDGVPVSSDMEEKADFINSLVHEDAAQYFFFDGEKINDYSTASGSQYKEAIARILGIKEIENAIEDLRIIKKEFEKDRDAWVSKQKSYTNVLVQKNEADKKVQEYAELIAKYEREIAAANEAIQRNEDELKTFNDIREKVERKQHVSDEIADITIRLENAKRARDDCFKKNATLILAAIAYGRLKKEDDQGPATYYISSAVKDHLLHLIEQPVCVCGSTLDASKIAAIKSYIDTNFVTNDSLLLEKERNALFNACEKYREHGIQSKAAYLTFCEDIYKLVSQLADKKHELMLLKKEIGSFNEEAGEKIIRDIARLEAKKEEATERMTRTKVLYEQAQDALAEWEAQLAKYSQTDSEGKLCQRKLETTFQLEKVFSSYKEQLLEQKRCTVEEYATDVFREITNAPQKYKGIKIDSDYSLLLELTNGETYQIEPGRTLNPSTGQSKVISLSYIAGLNRSSNYAAPVIIDNPLGLFSDEHRTAITKYLPHFSKQVIFMVSTGDLTEKYRDILAPYVKTEYYLANESSGTWSKTTIASREEY